MTVTAKISAVTGIHCGDGAEYNFQGWRQPLSWQRRLEEWVAATNTFGADVAIDCGDEVDGLTTDSLKLDFLNGETSYLSVATDAVTGFQMPRLNVASNHIFGAVADINNINPVWDGVDGAPTVQDYFDNINSQTSGQSVTKQNFFTVDTNPYGYTADISGVRYVVVYMPTGGTMTAEVLNWIDARLAETSLPIVLGSHAHMWDDPNHTLGSIWKVGNFQDVYDLLDQYSLVQLVLGGHRHDHAWHFKRNGIHYLSFGGSVGIPYEDWVGSTNSYAMITMEAFAIDTPYGLKASLTVVGTGMPGAGSSQLPEKFGVL